MLSKEADQIQSEVFKNLINAIMLPQGIQINDLNELNQGTVLPKFTQTLLGEEIQGWKDIPDTWKNKPIFKQRIVSQVSANLSAIIKHLSTKDNAFKFMKAPESEKDLIAFLWLLISKFYIVQPKRSLVNQIADNLKDHSSALEIKNMSTSWENGLPFIALLSKASQGTIEYSDKGNSQSNYDYIKESCQKLNIPFVLTEKCISSKPDENCICIQAVIILKSMGGVEAPAQQSTNNDQNEQKKLDEKIADYKQKLQIALNTIDSEQVQINKLTHCFTMADIDYKRKYIHDFQASKKKICLDNYYIVRDAWSIIERNSNRTKIPIPSDLMKAEEVKQKIDQLDEMIKLQSDNLESDEKRLKQIDDEINSITTIGQAREKFNELKEKVDMDNWKQLSHNHIAYILGSKLESYEEDLKKSIEKYQTELVNFESIRNKIVTEIEGNSDDLIQLEKLVSSLDDSFYAVKSDYKSIEKIDDKTDVTFSEEELKSKLESVKKLLEENKANISIVSFEKELAAITKQYESASSEIQKLDEYKNVYSSCLKETAKNEHPVDLPNYNKLELLLKEVGDNEDCTQRFEEIKKLIDSAKNSYENAFIFFSSRQSESKRVENCTELAQKKVKEFNNKDLQKSVVMLEKIKEQVMVVEDMKTWDDNAKGQTIDMYNECIKEAKELISNASQVIEDKFNLYLTEVKESIKLIKEERNKLNQIVEAAEEDQIDPSDELKAYKALFVLINENIVKNSALSITSEKMFYNKESEIDEINKELEEELQSLQDRTDALSAKVKQSVNSDFEQFKNFDTDELINQLKSDNSKLSDLSVEKIDESGSVYLDVYVGILKNKETIREKYENNEEELKQVNELISSITDILHDLIIIYKSTLLLSPKQIVQDLQERCELCQSAYFSLSMALLYAYKFNANNKYEIEDISEAKEEIESIVNPRKDFNVEVSKQICKRINEKPSLQNQIELKILCDFFEFVPDFEENFKDYLTTSIGNDQELLMMINNIKEFEYVPKKLLDVFKLASEKVNSLLRGKLCDVSKDISGNDISTIVADFGSFETRIGLGSELSPRTVFRTIVSTDKQGNHNKRIGIFSSRYSINCPIQHGIVTQWDDMVDLISYAFNDAGLDNVSEHPVLLCEPIKNPKANREKWCQIIFEQYNVPLYSCVNSNVLSLYSTGRTTGLVVECGHDLTSFAPVVNGYSMPSHTNVQKYGGNDVTNLFLKELGRNYEILKSSSSIEIVENLKREKCFVALDYEAQKSSHLCENFHLSDGQTISIYNEMVTSTEYLFDPSIDGNHSDGIPKTLFDTIMKIDIDYRKMFASNIFITGGTSRLKGFTERVEKEMNKMASPSLNFDYIKAENEKYPTWLGGSLLSSLPVFPQMLLSHDEYNDSGPSIIHHMFIH